MIHQIPHWLAQQESQIVQVRLTSVALAAAEKAAVGKTIEQLCFRNGGATMIVISEVELVLRFGQAQAGHNMNLMIAI